MDWLPLRLHPGDDLRLELERAAAAQGFDAAMVVSGIGSLSVACLRYAGVAQAKTLREDLEIVSIAGSIAVNGAHLHAVVSRADGSLRGGHAGHGCIVRTTAELLLVRLDGWRFERTMDASTGFAELAISRLASRGDEPDGG